MYLFHNKADILINNENVNKFNPDNNLRSWNILFLEYKWVLISS